MSQCDSKKEIEARLDIDFEDRCFDCNRCNSDQSKSEEDLDARECHDCGVEHLDRNMFQKIKGWLCFDCAHKYEKRLLKGTI